MDKLSFQNPLFTTYVIAATLMILKGVAMAWLTVVRMIEVKGGFRSPEDIRKTLMNPEPHAAQLAPNEHVERIRRIQMNDLESLNMCMARSSAIVAFCAALRLRETSRASSTRSSKARFAASNRCAVPWPGFC